MTTKIIKGECFYCHLKCESDAYMHITCATENQDRIRKERVLLKLLKKQKGGEKRAKRIL